MTPLARSIAAFVALPFFLPSAVQAAATTWSGGGADANWGTSGNWGTALANSFSADLVFTGSNRTSNTNNLANGTATSITFDAAASAFTISGSSINLSGNVANNSGFLQTIGNNVTFTGNPTVTGSNVTFSGTTIFTNAGSKTLTNNVTTGNTLTLSTVNLNSSATQYTSVTLAGTGNTVFGNIISNTGNLSGGFIISNSGTTTLSGANTYTVATTISGGGSIVLGNRNALGNGGSVTFSTNPMSFSASADLTGTNAVANPFTIGNNASFSGSNSVEFSGAWTQNSNSARTLTNNLPAGKTLKFSGNLYLSDLNNRVGNLTIAGPGAAELSGTLANFNGSGVASPLTVSASGTTTFSGQSVYTGTFGQTGAGTVNLTGTMNGPSGITVSNAGALFNETATGSIQGAATTFTLSNGVANLSASNSYGGNTTLTTGTLNLGDKGALSAGALLANGGAFGALVPLTGGSAVANPVTLGGSVFVQGTNSLQLNGAITNSGSNRTLNSGIAPASGTLTLAGNLYLSESSTVSRTLTLAGSGNTIISGTIANNSALSGSAGSLTLTNTGMTTLAGQSVFTGAYSQTSGGSVSLTGTINGPSNITVNNAAALFNESATGSIQGVTTTFTLTAGSATFFGANSFGGSTTVGANAMLQIGAGTPGNDGSLASPSIVNSGTIGFNLAGSQSISGAISGTGSVVKSGAGMLLLTGSNAYTGATTINSGTLQVGDGTNGSLAAASAVTVNAASVLTVKLADGGTFGSQIYNWDGVVNLVSGGTNILTGYLGGSVSGVMNQSGSGTTIVTSTGNQFFGTTNINAGVLRLASPTAAQDSTVRVNIDGGLAFGVNATTIGALSGSGSFVLMNGMNVVALTVGGINSDSVYSGVISGNGSVTKTGTGTLTLTGSSSYTGPTNINGGVVAITGAGSLGDGSATNTIVFNGGVLISTDNTYDLGANRSISLLSSGTLQADSGTLTVSGSVSGTKTLTVTGAGTVNLSGIVVGGASIAKTGAGTLVLSGSNSFNGGTTISSGTVQLGNSLGLGANTASLTVNGGTLDLNGHSTSLGAFNGSAGTVLNNSASTSSTIAVGNTVTSGTFAGLIADGLGQTGFTKNSGGLVALTGTNTFTGLCIVHSGMLAASYIGNAGTPGNLGAAPNAANLLNTAIQIDSPGVLSYVGPGETTDRNILITGAYNGIETIAANGTGALILSGTIAAKAQNATHGAEWLVLGGSNTAVNTVAGPVLESGAANHTSLSKQDTGTWFVSGAKSYAAVTDVQNGILQFDSIANSGSACSLGTGAQPYAILPSVRTSTLSNLGTVRIPYQIALGSGSTSGVLQYVGATDGPSNRQVGLNGNGTLSVAAGAGALTITGSVTPIVSNNVTLTLDASNAGANTIGGVIADAGSASTAISASGTAGANYINIDSTTGFYIGQSLSGGALAANTIVLGVTSGTLFVSPNTIGTSSNGASITGGGAQMALAKTGTGAWQLTANNTYTGATTINAGTLQLGDGIAGHDGTIAGASIVNQATLAYNLSGSQSYGGVISGSGNIVKSGSGTLALSGSNTYAGGSIVGGGTLQIGNANALGTGGLTVNGGTLDLHGNSVNVPAFSGAGGSVTNMASGTSTLTVAAASGTSVYAGNIADEIGAVVLANSGSGTLILSGSLTMTGLNANSGVAQLTHSGSIGAVSVATGAALSMAAHSGSTYNVLDTSSLTLATGGSMDLWNNAMILRASGTSENATNLTAVKAAMNAASNGLRWNGTGIGSTTAFNEAQLGKTQALALMVYDNTVIAQGSFEGVSGLGYFDSGSPVGFNQVLVKLTYLGDFNADGVINASDYTWLDGFALSGNVLGDLNGDGSVNATDYTWLDGSALNQSFGVLAAQPDSSSGILPLSAPAVSLVTGAAPASPEAVPEPDTLGLLLAGTLGSLFRRRNGRVNTRYKE